MKYLLDTGPLVAYLLGRQGAVAHLDALIHRGEAATSSLVYAEAIEYFQSFATSPIALDRYRVLSERRGRVLDAEHLVMQPDRNCSPGEALTLEFANTPLSQFTVAYQPDKRHFRHVTNLHLFMTPYQSHQSPQLAL